MTMHAQGTATWSWPALTEAYAAGATRPHDTAAVALRRIHADGVGPVWISVFEEGRLAGRCDELETWRKNAGPDWQRIYPLWGIPCGIKDNIDVAELSTTAACPAFAYNPASSAEAVRLLEAAGALVVGKTNLDQFAAGLVGTRSPYGACRAPFDARYISGGSSSGSAVAVARGHACFSLGTDTAGSGRVPAAFCELVGYKPTRGLISTRGVVPACRSLDCVSVFAASVAEAERVAAVLRVLDADDPYARPETESPASQDLPLRVGVLAPAQREFFGDGAYAAAYEASLVRWKQGGATLHEIDFTPFAQAAKLLYSGGWLAERQMAAGRLLRENPGALWPVTREILAPGAALTGVDVFQGMYRLQDCARRAARVWQEVDILVLPTAPTFPLVQQVDEAPIELNARLGTYTNFVNLLDLCALALPCRRDAQGRPFGITVVAPAHADKRIMKLGACYLGESGHFRWRKDRRDDVLLAVAGAHLSGQPLNHELTRLGAVLVRTTRTAPTYRAFALPVSPPKPGLARVGDAAGEGFEVEVWSLPVDKFGSFVAGVPSPLSIGDLELSDGSRVKGFLCEPIGLEGAMEITKFGSWRSYLGRRPA